MLSSFTSSFSFGRGQVRESGVITDGLQLYLRPSVYSGSGTSWTDSSPNAYTVTLSGAPSYKVIYFKFDGTEEYFDTNQSLASNSFSVGCWFNTSAAGIKMLLSKETTAGWPWNYRIWLNGGQIVGDVADSSASSEAVSSNLTTYNNGTWYYVMFTRNESSLLLYVNGVEIKSSAATLASIENAQEVWFGRSAYTGGGARPTGSYQYTGDIGECFIYNRVLSAAEILQNYNATKQTYAHVTNGLALYYDPSNTLSYSGSGATILDMSGNGLNGNLSNITYTDPYFVYNGTSSQVSVTDNTLLEPGTGDWTMEVWFNTTEFKTGSAGVLLGKFDPGGGSQDVSYSVRTNNTGSLYAQIGDGAGGYINSTTYQTSLNTWAQVTYVWKNVAANSLETYINGSSIGSVAHSLAQILNTTANLYIGSYNGGEYSQWFNGKIGIVRMYNRALSGTEVLQNYNANKSIYGL